ncbi:cation:proton antiporter [Enemella sp. A6]|uniref:cation:proton antiporter n=1 Tax=Enemella sp. A6 TaxID=3440152 RepID=UPI003EB6EC4E
MVAMLNSLPDWVWLTDVPWWMSMAGQVLMVLGAGLFATSALGMVRLPDLFSKASGVATASGLGISLVITGVFLLVPGWATLPKLIAAVALQLLTAAVGEMSIARAAYLVGSPVYSPTKQNALAEEADRGAPDSERPDDSSGEAEHH